METERGPLDSFLNVRTDLNFLTSPHSHSINLAAHPCNVKELKVLVGTSEDEDDMTEVLHVGLKNDTSPETFILNHVNGTGIALPTLFVKIIPMMSVYISIPIPHNRPFCSESDQLVAGLMAINLILQFGTFL